MIFTHSSVKCRHGFLFPVTQLEIPDYKKEGF